MGQIFPKSANRVPGFIFVGIIVAVACLAYGIYYFGSPKYTDVGYQPEQPVPYSHLLHADTLGMDCRYCHTGVEVSAVAMVPPTQTCMNCHTMILPESELLAPIRESWNTGKPVECVRVHNIPDYAYFNHSAHLKVGIGCESCHGNIASMAIVRQTQPLSMRWCLDCHKDPSDHLRPLSDVTKMNWVAPANQKEFAAKVIAEKRLNPPIDCSGCHR